MVLGRFKLDNAYQTLNRNIAIQKSFVPSSHWRIVLALEDVV
jgi:hypothetical protein